MSNAWGWYILYCLVPFFCVCNMHCLFETQFHVSHMITVLTMMQERQKHLRNNERKEQEEASSTAYRIFSVTGVLVAAKSRWLAGFTTTFYFFALTWRHRGSWSRCLIGDPLHYSIRVPVPGVLVHFDSFPKQCMQITANSKLNTHVAMTCRFNQFC
jgi:hypothetical protein